MIADFLKDDVTRLLDEHRELKASEVERWSIEAHTAVTFQAIVNLKTTGRLLDGREWNEMPEVANAA